MYCSWKDLLEWVAGAYWLISMDSTPCVEQFSDFLQFSSCSIFWVLQTHFHGFSSDNSQISCLGFSIPSSVQLLLNFDFQLSFSFSTLIFIFNFHFHFQLSFSLSACSIFIFILWLYIQLLFKSQLHSLAVSCFNIEKGPPVLPSILLDIWDSPGPSLELRIFRWPGQIFIHLSYLSPSWNV